MPTFPLLYSGIFKENMCKIAHQHPINTRRGIIVGIDRQNKDRIRSFKFTSNPEVEKHLSTNHKNNDTIHTFLSLSLGQFHLSIHQVFSQILIILEEMNIDSDWLVYYHVIILVNLIIPPFTIFIVGFPQLLFVHFSLDSRKCWIIHQ